MIKRASAVFAAAALALTGCSGEDGDPGARGQDGSDGTSCTVASNGDGTSTVTCTDGTTATIANGTDGTNGSNGTNGQSCLLTANPDGTRTLTCPDGSTAVLPVLNAPTVLKATITGVTAPTPAAVVGTVVDFKLVDQANVAVTALPAGTSISLTYAKLKDGQWKSYLNRVEAGVTTDSKGNPVTPVSPNAIQGTTQGVSTTALVNLGGGNYRYTLTATNTTAEAVAYEASLTHRIGLQVHATGVKPFNTVHDFVPAGGTVTVTRNIATTVSCLSCHEQKFGFHGSSARVEVEYCVTCHNPGTKDAETGNSLDMATMVHKIHAGEHLGNGYIIYGHGGTKYDFSHVTYPQPLRNCSKCHSPSEKTPDGNNWRANPTRAACGGCHDDVNFATGANHGPNSLAQDTDDACRFCHSQQYIETKHLTPIVTTNNPSLPTGRASFEYVIRKVTVAGGRATFEFQIKKDGAPVTLETFVAGGTQVVAGFTAGPSFYVASAVPQLVTGVTGTAQIVPADFNVGTSAPSVSLTNVWDGTRGALTALGDGFYSAVIGGGTANHTGADLAAGAEMVTGVMIGSFTHAGGTCSSSNTSGCAWGKAAYKTAETFTARRKIVSDDKCNACHERLGFEPTFHTGARSNAEMCTICHNTNRNSGGWSSNMRDFVHAVHAAGGPGVDHGVRTNKYGWHADLEYWNVTYPGRIANCQACHEPGTYDFSASAYTANGGALIGKLFPSTATSALVHPADYAGTVAQGEVKLSSTSAPWLAAGDYRDASVDKSANLVVSPITSACLGCHDAPAAVTHIRANGGQVYGARSGFVPGGESCLVCHGPGRSVAIDAAHK